ncbi:MAG: hypothetical protein LQ349_000318 [Xanthoria aureola]|nr:MAG: hypothetical protein LQ349_000318 [Xanthoria aureola]
MRATPAIGSPTSQPAADRQTKLSLKRVPASIVDIDISARARCDYTPSDDGQSTTALATPPSAGRLLAATLKVDSRNSSANNSEVEESDDMELHSGRKRKRFPDNDRVLLARRAPPLPLYKVK